MMRPKFEQVLEYVRAGEEDPQIEEMLRHDPDGQENLKQARFIVKMLGRRTESTQDESTDDTDLAAAPEISSMMSTQSDASFRRISFEEIQQPSPDELMPKIFDLVRDATSSTSDLGTLEVLVRDEQVFLSFEPGKSSQSPPPDADTIVPKEIRTYFQAAISSSESYESRPDAIQILGSGIKISLAEVLPVGRPLFLRISNTNPDVPATWLDLIFMPETGAFVKISTNTKGLAKLPVPEVSGVLRIGGDRPHLLHIKIKK